jgi:hypothetical protein
MGWYTDRRTRAFDRKYGTDTFDRAHLSDLEVAGGLDPEFGTWMYGPINPDFFHEMMKALPVRLEDYGFFDIGAGKGLALMLAGDYPFREIVGIEFSPPLVESGRRNVEIYRRATGKSFDVEWVVGDFLRYAIPPRPALYFMNAPFPHGIAEQVIRHIEASLVASPRKVVILYRKPHPTTLAYLSGSPQFEVLRRTPYWYAYASRAA